MTLITSVPFLVCLLGGIVYAISSSTKAQELGRLAFACGLLVALFAVASRMVHFG